jgi:hypothetical protein
MVLVCPQSVGAGPTEYGTVPLHSLGQRHRLPYQSRDRANGGKITDELQTTGPALIHTESEHLSSPSCLRAHSPTVTTYTVDGVESIGKRSKHEHKHTHTHTHSHRYKHTHKQAQCRRQGGWTYHAPSAEDSLAWPCGDCRAMAPAERCSIFPQPKDISPHDHTDDVVHRKMVRIRSGLFHVLA